jgi:NADP-dependent 3-hydroxy acid dehydrogenase YdfG/Flp pilus assembly protein TadD
MSVKNITIAYCQDNVGTADRIRQNLQIAEYNVQTLSCNKSTKESALTEQLLPVYSPIILLVSDNFLKSAQCMARGLKLLQEKRTQLYIVVVPGVSQNPQTGEREVVHTEFEKVGDIIQYINYWQDQYLDLRRQKRQMKEGDEPFDEENFNQHLRVMRDISSQVGEYLRLLRNMDHLYLEQFDHNHHEILFQNLGDHNGWELLKAASPAPEPVPAPEESINEVEEEAIDLSGIPGIELLPDQTSEDEGEPSTEAGIADVLEESIPESSELDPEPVEEPTSEESSSDEAANHSEEEIETPAADAGAEVQEEEEEEEEEEDTPLQSAEIIGEALELIRSGHRSRALSHLEQAIENYPNDLDIRYHYALLLAQNATNLHHALHHLDHILEIEPDHLESNFLKAEIAEVNEDFGTALQYYEKVADIDDDYPDLYYRMGLIRASLEGSDKNEAADNLKKAIQQDPSNIDAHYQYGVLMGDHLDKPKKAEKYFKRTIELDEDHPFAFYDLALLYHGSGKFAAAREAYLEAVENNPELKTPENEAAFTVPVTHEAAGPGLMLGETEQMEINAISALKENISRLEQLLQQREQEALAFQKEQAERAEQERAARAAEAEEKARIAAAAVKTVLITGATSGIGRATAQLFAEHGHRVIITGRRMERLEELKAEFEGEYEGEIHPLNFDVRNFEASKAAFEQLPEMWQQIDILINNAGKAKGLAPIHEGQLEHWDEMIDTNIKGLLYMTRLVAPTMVARQEGHIINLASTAGKEVYPKGNVYCATKFAVEALTRGMRLDLHPYNIRVSQVSPAHVEETEFALVRFDGDAERAKIYEDFKPLTSADVARSIYFIATQPAHVNIQDILMMGTQQASAFMIDRSGRDRFEEEE